MKESPCDGVSIHGRFEIERPPIPDCLLGHYPGSVDVRQTPLTPFGVSLGSGRRLLNNQLEQAIIQPGGFRVGTGGINQAQAGKFL